MAPSKDVIWSTRHGRFVLAHEIGHLLLHAEHDVLSVCLDGTAKLAAGARKIEGEASDAGCEILMPEAWFAPDCRGEAPGMEQAPVGGGRCGSMSTWTAVGSRSLGWFA